MRNSTRALFRLNRGSIPRFLHAYFYARWPALYLALARRALEWARTTGNVSPGGYWERSYHSKVLRREEAEKIIRLDRPLTVPEPERVVPFEGVNRIILSGEGPFAVITCPCRQTRGEAGCRPRDVCLAVGEPFVGFMLEHGSAGARSITREEALAIIAETDRRGNLHTAWFKDAMGGRFYAICNCCPCCCLGLLAMRRSGNAGRTLLPSGYAAAVERERCTACGACLAACPFGALREGAEGRPEVEEARCFGCGICRSRCPAGAISLRLAPSRGVPLDVEELSRG